VRTHARSAQGRDCAHRTGLQNPASRAQGLRFTLTKPVTAAACPSHAELLWMMCDAAEKLTPLSAEEEARLAQKSAAVQPLFTA